MTEPWVPIPGEYLTHLLFQGVSWSARTMQQAASSLRLSLGLLRGEHDSLKGSCSRWPVRVSSNQGFLGTLQARRPARGDGSYTAFPARTQPTN